MRIENNISLKSLNTFKVDVKAETLITIESSEELNSPQIKEYTKKKHIFLGRGSNTLFTKDFDGTVILLRNSGIEILEENSQYVKVKVNAGHQWNDLVYWSTESNLIGLQNLIDIPGNVGSSPIQNIGAYGIEVKDFIDSVNIYILENGQREILTNQDCHFSYRDSIFKNELHGKAVIESVVFKLEKYSGVIDERYISYKDIKERLDGKNIDLKNLLNCVRDIRKEKLPDIKEYGTCGSTFKNLLIDKVKYTELEKQFEGLPSFETEDTKKVKIPTAYILDKLGWKNKREGDVGTWIYHPLIVTNYGNASGEQILSFINKMQDDFKSNTGLDLETEINIF